MKELGARIVQDLLSGLCIAPVYPYSPFEEAKATQDSNVNASMNSSGHKLLTTSKSGVGSAMSKASK